MDELSAEGLLANLRAHRGARVLLAAVELDLFTVLDEKCLRVPDLARAVGTSERGMTALLTGLLALGFVTQGRDGTYASAPAARRLLSRHSETWRGAAALVENELSRRLAYLTDSVRTGRPPDVPRDPRSVLAEVVAACERDAPIAGSIAAALPLPGKKRILDLGAGAGTLVEALLHRDPDATATLYDVPLVLDAARRVLGKDLLASGRLRLKGGDLLEDPVPMGFDLVLLSDVVRLFEPVEARRILRKARGSLAPGGELAIRELWLDADQGATREAALAGISLLVSTRGGRVYGRIEGLEWVAGFGLEDPRWVKVEEDPEHEILLARSPD